MFISAHDLTGSRQKHSIPLSAKLRVCAVNFLTTSFISRGIKIIINNITHPGNYLFNRAIFSDGSSLLLFVKLVVWPRHKLYLPFREITIRMKAWSPTVYATEGW